MKKISKLLTAVALVVLAGCSQARTPEKISVLVPQGATALATLNIYNNDYADVTSVAGSDVITSELAKKDSTYDVIIAPLNIGTKMIAKGNSEYRLDSIITWGNLYIVANDAYQIGDPIAAFGENAVPGLVLSYLNYGKNEEVTYFNSPQDVQAQLLTGKVNAGLLAEPAATATIAKGEEKNLKLSVQNNIQGAYAKTSGSDTNGYPQAAIFVKQGSEKKAKDAIAEIETFVNNTKGTSEELTEMIDKAGVENLGVPNAQIAIKSWERQNIRYEKAVRVKAEITAFLKLFDITFDDSMLSK